MVKEARERLEGPARRRLQEHCGGLGALLRFR